MPKLLKPVKRFFSGALFFKIRALTLILFFFVFSVSPVFAVTLPTGGSFAAGGGTISSSGSSMTVNQNTAKGIINWQGFSIGQGGSVFFNNGAGATLNRVTGGSLSSIAGLLRATGSLYLINPSGIVITSAGSVITGGDFIASTLNISNSDFLNSNYIFSGLTGSVTNNGSIVSSGNTVLVGTVVTNNGTVSSPNGTASLVSGTRLVLIPENGPSGILISPSSISGNVTNSGIIKAASVYLSSSNGDVYALAGNNGGLIEATGTKTINGQVWLTAPSGTVSVNAPVTASNYDGSGGTILIDGLNNYINSNSILNASGSGGVIKVGLFPSLPESLFTTLSSGAQLLAGGVNGKGFIDTSGDTLSIGNITVNANGGEWFLDPSDFTIDSTNNSAIDSALGSGSVTITTASSGTTTSPSLTSGSYNTNTGDINIDAPISWSNTNSLTLSAYNSINVNSTITASGGGGLVLDYNTAGATSNYATDTGVLNFPWAAGGGFAGSIQFTDGTNASVGSTSAPVGSLTINGNAYTLINDYNINDINNNTGSYLLSGDYALATNITAPSSFTPIGESTAFTGTFNGLGNTVNNLTIGTSSSPYSGTYAGLFGQIGSGGSARNIGLTNE
ncbi:MAG: two-partner secretion domain-containing protein, partial [bacterium]